MEDNINYFLKKEDNLNFLIMEYDLKKIMQPKTIKSKSNDCGTAPGNLVFIPFICWTFDMHNGFALNLWSLYSNPCKKKA